MRAGGGEFLGVSPLRAGAQSNANFRKIKNQTKKSNNQNSLTKLKGRETAPF